MEWTTIQIPLSNGMTDKTDDRALQPPALAFAQDCVFDEIGGIQVRPPYPSITTQSDDGAGNLSDLSDVRKVVRNGDELLLFTKERLYSYNEAGNAFVDRGEHLAVAIDETPVCETTSDQTQSDRAELDGVIVYCYRDEALAVNGGGGGGIGPGPSPLANGGYIFVAAVDKATGAYIVPPTALAVAGVSANETRPRVIATSVTILLFSIDVATGNFLVRSIDPTAPLTGITSDPTLIYAPGTIPVTPTQMGYDVRLNNSPWVSPTASNVAFAYNVFDGAHYKYGFVNSSMAVTIHTANFTSDGPIAVAPDPSHSDIGVIRTASGVVKADLWTTVAASVFSDVTVASDAATQVSALRVLGNGATPHAFRVAWSYGEQPDALNSANTVTANITGAGSVTVLATTIGVALTSHLFYRLDDACFHVVFAQDSDAAGGVFGGTISGVVAAQLQNAVFLYDMVGGLHGKALATRAGGYESEVGLLSGVAQTDTDAFSWACERRRIVPLGTDTTNGKAYSARSPVDIVDSFDDNRARRCVRLGETLYVTGAEVKAFDGLDLVEVGFHVYPWQVDFLDSTITGTPAIPDGSYTYKCTYRYDNARGERERSTTATYPTIVLTGGPSKLNLQTASLQLTHKQSTQHPVVIEYWRTVKDGLEDSPFYLATSLDPFFRKGSSTRFNPFIPNAYASLLPDSFDDNLTDAELTKREENEEVGGVLESLAPPAASIIAASQSRIFLAGVAGDPHRVWYSKLRDNGQIAAFDDALTFDVPPAGGKITALAIMSETLVVFRERACYVIPGEGYDNTGGGTNYGPARVVSADCGAVSAEAIALVPMGLLFKTAKGWYLMSTNWQVQYVGGSVSDYDGENVVAVDVLESQHHVRISTTTRMLVWDYLVNQWCVWDESNLVSACTWQGRHVIWKNSSGGFGALYIEQTLPYDFATAGTNALEAETPWIKINDLAGRGRVRWIVLTGEFRAANRMRVRVAMDYAHDADGDPVWFDDVLLTPTTSLPGDLEQFRHGPSRQRCQAIKVRISAWSDSANHAATSEAFKLTGLALEVGGYRGLVRSLAAAQKG